MNNPIALYLSDSKYPSCLHQKLGAASPSILWALGNLELLKMTKTAFFCSTQCPGGIILSTYDRVKAWRDGGRCIISGFHSAVEKECLRILLRGKQPIIICPARSLQDMRIPREWRPHMESGQLLLLSEFATTQRRPDIHLAERRNKLVVALADDIHIAHAAPGGKVEQFSKTIAVKV